MAWAARAAGRAGDTPGRGRGPLPMARSASKRDAKPSANPFGSVGRTVLCPSTPSAGFPPGAGVPRRPSLGNADAAAAAMSGSRPASSCSMLEDRDEDWRQMRASIKSLSAQGAPAQRSGLEPCGASASGAPPEHRAARAEGQLLLETSSIPCTPSGHQKLTPSKAKLPEVPVPARVLQRAAEQCQQREAAYFENMKSSARATSVGGFDSIITFLEMNSLSGAYALGLAAGGFESLSQLLLADEADVNKAIEACEMDSVDEILLKEAMQSARGLPTVSPRITHHTK